MSGCEKLTSLQGCPSTLEKFIGPDTGIASLEGLESTSIKKLVVSGCEKLESLKGAPPKLEELTGLADTGITSLEGLESTSIKKLVVGGCKKLASLQGCPRTLEELDASVQMKLTGSTAKAQYMGVYERSEKTAHGAPVFVKKAGNQTHYLYRYTDGKWQATDDEENIAEGARELEALTVASLPSEAGLSWKYLDSEANTWQEDSAITCTTVVREAHTKSNYAPPLPRLHTHLIATAIVYSKKCTTA